jgi:hypothetical protein
MLTTHELVLEYSTLTKVVSNIKNTFVETIPNIIFPWHTQVDIKCEYHSGGSREYGHGMCIDGLDQKIGKWICVGESQPQQATRRDVKSLTCNCILT